jgi:hypothetical protein
MMKTYTWDETIDALLNYNVLAEKPAQWSRDNIRGLHSILNEFDFYTDGDGYWYMPSEMDDDEMLISCMTKDFDVPEEVCACGIWELGCSIDAKKAA